VTFSSVLFHSLDYYPLLLLRKQKLTFNYLDFEWGSGQSTRFGLQHVNYTDLTRTPKASMFTFVNWFKQHGARVEEGGHENSTYRMAR
jgi:hypothetical protein